MIEPDTQCQGCGTRYVSTIGHRCGESPEEAALRGQLADKVHELKAASLFVTEYSKQIREDADELAALEAKLANVVSEREEAREWVRKLTREERVLTCIYCGHAYPPGSPTHGAEVLTEHAMTCQKHPLATAVRALRDIRIHADSTNRVVEIAADALAAIRAPECTCETVYVQDKRTPHFSRPGTKHDPNCPVHGRAT
jgi:hypothetical protein